MTPPAPQSVNDIGPPNSGLGLALFGLYAILFATFLLVNVAAPDILTLDSVQLTDERALSLKGMNLAVILGLGLIFAAMFLVLIFVRLTRQRRR